MLRFARGREAVCVLAMRTYLAVLTRCTNASMKIKKLPNVLALHLKRFKYQEDVQRYIKLSYRVAFPFELRLFNTVDDAQDPDRLYELFAIVVHVGRYAFPTLCWSTSADLADI